MMQLRFLASILGGFLISSYSVYAASYCAPGYTTAVHTIHFDYNTSTNETSVITTTTKGMPDIYTMSEDGSCPSGYSVHTRNDDYFYPLMEETTVCTGGQHLLSGTCKSYASLPCQPGRYNSGLGDVFTVTPDGSCINGYTSYTRNDDYFYPLVVDYSSHCGSNQYPGGGTCRNYAQSTCPSGYHSYSLNANTIAEQSDGACPTNYELYTDMASCDIAQDPTCVDSPIIINLLWYDGINETPSQSTCRYNQQITLPPTPVRPGYVFGGWRVKTNN